MRVYEHFSCELVKLPKNKFDLDGCLCYFFPRDAWKLSDDIVKILSENFNIHVDKDCTDSEFIRNGDIYKIDVVELCVNPEYFDGDKLNASNILVYASKVTSYDLGYDYSDAKEFYIHDGDFEKYLKSFVNRSIEFCKDKGFKFNV